MSAVVGLADADVGCPELGSGQFFDEPGVFRALGPRSMFSARKNGGVRVRRVPACRGGFCRDLVGGPRRGVSPVVPGAEPAELGEDARSVPGPGRFRSLPSPFR